MGACVCGRDSREGEGRERGGREKEGEGGRREGNGREKGGREREGEEVEGRAVETISSNMYIKHVSSVSQMQCTYLLYILYQSSYTIDIIHTCACPQTLYTHEHTGGIQIKLSTHPWKAKSEMPVYERSRYTRFGHKRSIRNTYMTCTCIHVYTYFKCTRTCTCTCVHASKHLQSYIYMYVYMHQRMQNCRYR